MDFLKDAFEAYRERIRSPILGSIAIAFFACNWKAIWFLLFSDVPIILKFVYFDLQTTPWTLYVWPALIGTVIALLTPWVTYIGARAAIMPMERLSILQDNQAAAQEDRKSQIKNDLEKREANRKKVVQDSIIETDNRISELRDSGKESTAEKILLANKKIDAERILSEIGELEKIIISNIFRSKNGITITALQRRSEISEYVNFNAEKNQPLTKQAIRNALNRLLAFKVIDQKRTLYNINELGKIVYEKILQNTGS